MNGALELAPRESARRPTPAPTPAHTKRWTLRDPALLTMLLATLVLQVFAHSLMKGYPNADAVEYLDRAQLYVNGDYGRSAGTIRSLGFSSLFVPLFLLAKVVGIEDLRHVPQLAILFQSLIGLALVTVCARIGDKLAGRGAGLVAGWAAAFNPFLIAYSVNPVSGLMCATFVALALERGLFEQHRRAAIWTGLLFGLAILMAMQAIPIAIGSIVALCLRNGRRGWRESLWIWFGFALGLSVLVVLDRVVYQSYGLSLRTYFLSNFGSAITPLLMKLGLREWAVAVYEASKAALSATPPEAVPAEASLSDLRRMLPVDWYFRHLPTFLVWPVLVLTVLGVLRAVVRPRWTSSVLLLVLALNVAVLSGKGSKEFRLWLPLIPFTCGLCAVGWVALTQTFGGKGKTWRAAAGVLGLACAAPLAAEQLQQVEWRMHGGYWDAVRWIEDEGMAGERHARALSAYGWAVYLRDAPKLTFLRPTIDAWRFDDAAVSDAERAAMLDALARVDWYVTHLSVLQAAPNLTRWISEHMAVRAVFYDQEENSHVGPVLVFEKAGPGERAGRMVQAWTDRDRDQYMREHHFDDAVRFVKDDLSIQLMGWDYQRLPGGWGWLTLHWYFESEVPRSWSCSPYLWEQSSWTYWYDNHPLGMDMLPAEQRQAGTILAEGRLVVPSERVFIPGEPFRPLGGNWRRGDLIPALLCARMVILDQDGIQLEQLPAYSVGEDKPLGERLKLPNLWDPRGPRLCRDGAVVIGGLLLPVVAKAWHPDNGTEVPEVRILRSKKKRTRM